MRFLFVTIAALLPTLSSSSVLADSTQIGGAHVGYAFGGALAADDSGFRHGLDFAFMPVLFAVEHRSARDSISSEVGYVLGLSGIYGFGETSSYLALDFGRAAHSLFGAFAGFGPVYRFPKDERRAGYGGEGRVAFDVVLLELGFRLLVLGGKDSSEVSALFSAGLGRF